jgi:hypothetical protein
MNMRHGAVLLLASCLCLTGCEAIPEHQKGTVLVKGIVTFSGSPVAGATVTFLAAKDGRSASAITDAQGLYALAFPAVAGAHWLRACRQQVRSGGLSLTTVRRLLAAIPLAMAWGVGEAVGALLGRRRVERHTWRAEVKPVPPEWVAKHRRRTGQPLPPKQ